MKLELGKYYTLREGHIAGPMMESVGAAKDDWIFQATIEGVEGGDKAYFCEDGTCPYIEEYDAVSEIANMSQWIEHDGKSRPDLPPGTLVYTRHNNEYSDEHQSAPISWEYWDEPDDENSSWINWDNGPYIIAYRVVTK